LLQRAEMLIKSGMLDTSRLDEAAERTPVPLLRGAVSAGSESGRPCVLPMSTESGEANLILGSYRSGFPAASFRGGSVAERGRRKLPGFPTRRASTPLPNPAGCPASAGFVCLILCV